MIVCKEDKSNYTAIRNFGRPLVPAFKLAQTSVFTNHTGFVVWFCNKFSGTPSTEEQMRGKYGLKFKKLSTKDFCDISRKLSKSKEFGNSFNESLLDYLQSHIGKHICVEIW